MNSKVLKSILAASLALNVGFVGAVGYRYGFSASPRSTEPAASLLDRLALSDAQRVAWRALERPFLSELSSNWADIHTRRQALLDEVFSDVPDPARITAIQADIASLQDAQQKRVIAQLRAEQAVLNEGQRAKLKAILHEEYGPQVSHAEQLHQSAHRP